MNLIKKILKFPIIMGIAWGCILAVSVGIIVTILNYDKAFYSFPEVIANNIVSEDYGTLYYRINEQLKEGLSTEENPEYSELVAIARYMEASGQYHMYLNNNQADKAEYYYNKMQAALAKTGLLQCFGEDIDLIFKNAVKDE